MAFYSYLSTKIIIAFITKSYKDLFGVRSYINALQITLLVITLLHPADYTLDIDGERKMDLIQVNGQVIY